MTGDVTASMLNEMARDKELLPDYDVPRPKMSDLIRQGCKLYPQAFGYWWMRGEGRHEDFMTKAPITGTCALGAAATAIGHDDSCRMSTNALFHVLGWRWGELPYVMYPQDAGCWQFSDRTKPMDIMGVIAALNDDARWTRERIADWLQSIGF